MAETMTQSPGVWLHVATNISWEGSQWAYFQQPTLNSCTRNFPMQIENDEMKGERVVGTAAYM